MLMCPMSMFDCAWAAVLVQTRSPALWARNRSIAVGRFAGAHVRSRLDSRPPTRHLAACRQGANIRHRVRRRNLWICIGSVGGEVEGGDDSIDDGEAAERRSYRCKSIRQRCYQGRKTGK